MVVQCKNICFLCATVSPYGGNFYCMMLALASLLSKKYNAHVFFVFPNQEKKLWQKELEGSYTVYYTTSENYGCAEELSRQFQKWKIDLVHTHFEAYDIPTSQAISLCGRDIKQVWHLHDYQSLDKNGLSFKFLRKIGTNFRFWKQYGYYGREAYFIGVSSEITNFITHYRHHILSFPQYKSNDKLDSMTFGRAEVVINGIDQQRLLGKDTYFFPEGKTVFLSFGGESKSKGIPCIFEAAEKLYSKGYDFEVKITKGYTTEHLLEEIYPKALPQWLKIIDQTEDIAGLFNQSHCYISASLKETMSMAIAEASIYGLPVIQSDIPGTWWNSHSPSTFLFPVNDSNALCQQMERIIVCDKDKLTELCKSTSKFNSERLSMDAWCNSILSVYEKL